jgi:acetylornithine deacetylase/succinyl-diaminopimelate desuccinylase-like protein
MRLRSSLSSVLTLALLSASLLTIAQAQTSNLSPTDRLALDIFREIVEINTTHQFGNTKAAQALQSRLKSAGFLDADAQLVGPNPNKLNLVARIHGTDRAKPILFIAHLDVVDARKEDWSPGLDPFKFTERDGFFYGRGTIDVKDEAASLTANLIRLKQTNFVSQRDIIIALTADEEAGGDANGVDWLLQNRHDLIDAAYCVNMDVGGGHIQNGKRVRFTVQTAEKKYLTFKLTVKSPGGHSALPTNENAIYRLANALTKLATFQFPVKLNTTTRAFFERTAANETGQLANDMKAAAANPGDTAALSRLALSLPLYNAMMRTTCVATMLEAGHAENALPQMATATVNCRLLPEDTPEEVQKTLENTVADPAVTIMPQNVVRPSPSSPLTPEVMESVEQIVHEMWPGVTVIPIMDPWASDSVYLRQAKIPVYGAGGIFYEIDPARAHGKDERVGSRDFFEGVEFTYRLMKALGSHY